MKLLLIPIVLGFMLLLFAAVGLSGNLGSLSSSGRGAAGGVLYSADEGATFEYRSKVVGDSDIVLNRQVTQLKPGSDSGHLFAVAPTLGVLYTQDAGENWERIFSGDAVAQAVTANPSNDTEVYVAATLASKSRIYKLSDTQAEWNEIYVEASSKTIVIDLHADSQDPNIVYALLSNGTLIKTFNAGADWVLASRVPIAATRLHVDPNNPAIVYIASVEKLYLSTDGGFAFEQLKTGIRSNSLTGIQITSFAVNPNNSSEIYIGSLGQMIRSQDQGKTWENINILTPSAGVPVQVITVPPQNSSTLYYVAGSVLYTSKNAGTSWLTQEIPRSIKQVTNLLGDTEKNDILYMSAQ